MEPKITPLLVVITAVAGISFLYCNWLCFSAAVVSFFLCDNWYKKKHGHSQIGGPLNWQVCFLRGDIVMAERLTNVSCVDWSILKSEAKELQADRVLVWGHGAGQAFLYKKDASSNWYKALELRDCYDRRRVLQLLGAERRSAEASKGG